MKMQTAACLAATMIVGLNGCSSTSAINRGQSIQQAGHHDHNVNTLPNRSGRVNSVQNHFSDPHHFPSTSSYHSTSGFPGYSGFAESGYPGSHVPGYGSCPPGGGCPPGHHGASGACGPHHYHSYSYQRPGNLSYPDQSAVGGAVVYPYYTHKGPSDFFRDDCSVLK